MAEPPSTATRDLNLLERFYKDGRNRCHIPPLPPLVAGLRAGQLLLNLVVLILAAVSASEISGELDAHSMTFFTFVWTLLHFGYAYGTATWAPEFYNLYAHIASEVLTDIWWLVTWALSASHASDIPTSSGGTFANTLRAVAGLGALQWVLFCATLFFLVTHSMPQLKELGTMMAKTGGSGGSSAPPGSAPSAASAAAEVPATQGGQQPVEMDQMGPGTARDPEAGHTHT